ncbi:MAG TPA: DNA mismatch repair endonuclease MutL, partial [Lachnospiraceae bacterium]|nr:DNA mismatch repair endonuclease MutL [Lachnospiraceae bacterium]
MKEIHVLEQTTIDKIAAGEVVERPGSIVKELCENALDAGATALTVEIRDGGISMIRVTDNGEGIDPTQVRRAFLRHATSKITQVDDLVSIRSFGFRGEALSSICAVSRVELITKVRENLTGVRYKIEGGSEKLFEEVGAPAGSTFIVRDLFYNTPARRKFLKSAQTEAGYISDFVSRLAMSHPHISVKFMVNSTTRLSTSGYGSQADVINAVFGREVRSNLIEVEQKEEAHGLLLKGWIGKPAVSRGNRTCEILYVNGRLVYNSIFSKAVEEGYETFLMQHRFPFVILQLTLPGSDVDVNVHPAKAQVRFTDGPLIFDFVKTAVKEHLTRRELVVESAFQNQAQEEAAKREARKRALEAQKAKDVPEPFETLRRQHNTPEGYLNGAGQGTSPYARQYPPQENAGQGKSPFARQWPSEEAAGSSREKIQAANQFLHEVRQLSIFDQDNHIHSPEKKESQPLMTEAGENRS